MLDKVFSSLKTLGFNNLDNLELYKKKTSPEDQNTKETKEAEIDINTLIFDKTVNCPICSKEFTTKAVKINAPKVQSTDSDFLIRYNIINPLLYDVWICPICGYSALKGDFHKIKSYQKENIIMKISNQWNGRKYPPILNEELAIERYKLALLNAVVSEGKSSTKAYICLKIAWLYRLLGKEKEEKDFLSNSLEGFLIAYNSEETPIYGLDVYSLMYLIGELYRRTEDYTNANLWFSNVIVSRNASYKIKEKSRDMRDLIKKLEG